jgi:hypothetical protein
VAGLSRGQRVDTARLVQDTYKKAVAWGQYKTGVHGALWYGDTLTFCKQVPVQLPSSIFNGSLLPQVSARPQLDPSIQDGRLRLLACTSNSFLILN